ncbi:hypothetical protein TNCV_2587941 [Trichonephila clavipes]|nr:hypothetical protein TNCV_2587941 [Trichonephila clavipes]
MTCGSTLYSNPAKSYVSALIRKMFGCYPGLHFHQILPPIENVRSIVAVLLACQRTLVTAVDELWHHVKAACGHLYLYMPSNFCWIHCPGCYYRQRWLFRVLIPQNLCT